MISIETKRLETTRLILRKATTNDAINAYRNWCNNDKVAKYVTWTKHKNIEETKELYKIWENAYDDLNTYRWVVELRDTKELIGSIDVSPKYLKYYTFEIDHCYREKY